MNTATVDPTADHTGAATPKPKARHNKFKAAGVTAALTLTAVATVAPAPSAQAVTYTGPDRVCVSYNSSATGPAYIKISIFNPLRILWPYYTKKLYAGQCSTLYTNSLNRMYGF